MRVLAIDTALEACSAAVLDTERGGILASESIPMLRGHAEALLPLVSRVMNEAGLEFAALDRIAVTVGPGSFTGLRVGVSAARGIAVAAGKPAVGLTTLAAFAAPYIAVDDVTPLVAAIDARNDQVYMQMFGAGGRSLIQPRVAGLREAVRDAANARARLAGSAPRLVAAGRGARGPTPHGGGGGPGRRSTAAPGRAPPGSDTRLGGPSRGRRRAGAFPAETALPAR